MQQLLQREIADVSVRLEREKEDHQQHIEEVGGGGGGGWEGRRGGSILCYSHVHTLQLQEEFEKEKKHIAKAHQVDLRLVRTWLSLYFHIW